MLDGWRLDADGVRPASRDLLKVNAPCEKQHAVTAYDDPVSTQLTMQFATTCRNLMRDEV